MEVHLAHVVQLDLEHLAYASDPGALASTPQVIDLQHGHVAALLAPRPLELADGGASCRVLGVNGRHDLEKGVSDREHGVRQAEVDDSRMAVRLAKPELPAKPLNRLLQVSRREDRLSKPRHRCQPTWPRRPGASRQGATWRQIEPRVRTWRWSRSRQRRSGPRCIGMSTEAVDPLTSVLTISPQRNAALRLPPTLTNPY